MGLDINIEVTPKRYGDIVEILEIVQLFLKHSYHFYGFMDYSLFEITWLFLHCKLEHVHWVCSPLCTTFMPTSFWFLFFHVF